MKKRILLFLLAMPLLAIAQQEYIINGTLPNENLNGKTVYLREINSSFELTTIDSCMVSGKKFNFKGSAIDMPRIGFLYSDVNLAKGDNNPSAMIVLEAGNIEVVLDEPFNVRGTPKNDEFQKFYDKQNEIVDRIYKLDSPNQMNPQYQNLIEELKILNFDFINQNINNAVGEFFLIDMYQMFDKEQIKELLPKTRQQFVDSNIGKQLKHLVHSGQPAIGEQYRDITLKDINGKTVSLSDYVQKNKVILVDFWASWCGPCIKEMPNVIKAYETYKDKGLEIVGISLDESRHSWIQATQRMKMPWPQMSDLGGWQSEAAQLYGIKSIPFTLLLDQNGKIIGKNLRGTHLLDKLEQLLN